jgi:hypothetical protein
MKFLKSKINIIYQRKTIIYEINILYLIQIYEIQNHICKFSPNSGNIA